LHKVAVDALLDLVEFGEEILLFSASRDTESGDVERMRALAIERLFELFGECMNRALSVEPALKVEFPEAHRVVRMRNRLAHAYDSIDVEIVWETAETGVPELLTSVKQMLQTAREA
jgi:uncharacterized protein with HEPN domain